MVNTYFLHLAPLAANKRVYSKDDHLFVAIISERDCCYGEDWFLTLFGQDDQVKRKKAEYGKKQANRKSGSKEDLNIE